MKRSHEILLGLASGLTLVGLWHLGSILQPTAFPGVVETLHETWRVLNEPGPYGNPFYYHVYKTAELIFLSLAIAMVVGTIAGIAIGTTRSLEGAASSWIYGWLALPSLVVVFLSGIWFGFGWSAGLFSVTLIITPFVVLNMWEGALNLDEELIEMADFYGADRLMRFRWVTLPQLIPHVFASLRSGMSIGWKITLLVETFLFTHGVGFMFRRAFGNYNLAEVMSWLVIFVIFLLAIEYGVLKPIHQRVTHWRPDVDGLKGAG